MGENETTMSIFNSNIFQTFIFSVLRVQSMVEGEEYTFPAMREIAGMHLPNGSMANISIPLPKHNSGKLMRMSIYIRNI